MYFQFFCKLCWRLHLHQPQVDGGRRGQNLMMMNRWRGSHCPERILQSCGIVMKKSKTKVVGQMDLMLLRMRIEIELLQLWRVRNKLIFKLTWTNCPFSQCESLLLGDHYFVYLCVVCAPQSSDIWLKLFVLSKFTLI